MLEEKIRESTIDGQFQLGVFFDTSDVDIRSMRKEHERMCTHQCLINLLGTQKVNIAYKESGAPYIPSLPHMHLSISHSKNWYAILLSTQKPLGVDIQVIHKTSLFKGRGYYINDREEACLELSELNLYLIWCAKEALYKSRKGNVLNYKESLTVRAIEEKIIKTEVDGENIDCAYQIDDDVILVYTLP